jgi:hypothetical protein
MKKDDIIRRIQNELDMATDYHIEMKYGRGESPYVVEIVALMNQKESSRIELS